MYITAAGGADAAHFIGCPGALLGVICFFVTFFLIGLWHGRTLSSSSLAYSRGGSGDQQALAVGLVRGLGRKGYKALAKNPAYIAFGRGPDLQLVCPDALLVLGFVEPARQGFCRDWIAAMARRRVGNLVVRDSCAGAMGSSARRTLIDQDCRGTWLTAAMPAWSMPPRWVWRLWSLRCFSISRLLTSSTRRFRRFHQRLFTPPSAPACRSAWPASMRASTSRT